MTVLERDDTPMPTSADEAFEWDRRGAPQVRHSHAFLARLVGLLRREHPEVYAELLREGASEMRFGDDLPPTLTDFQLQPGDEELVMLACRRTTFEWVLRRCALADGKVEFRTGVGAEGLVVSTSLLAGVPHIAGVRLADGAEVLADLTVVADAHVPPAGARRRMVLRNLPYGGYLPEPSAPDAQPRAATPPADKKPLDVVKPGAHGGHQH